MDQKTQFIADYLRETFSVTELCDMYMVSRKTAYKWIDRYLSHRKNWFGQGCVPRRGVEVSCFA